MAHEIHRAFGTKGRFWQPEVFDHWLRDLVRIQGAIRYVELNPVAEGRWRHPLDWEFSSARRNRGGGLTPLSIGTPSTIRQARGLRYDAGNVWGGRNEGIARARTRG